MLGGCRKEGRIWVRGGGKAGTGCGHPGVWGRLRSLPGEHLRSRDLAGCPPMLLHSLMTYQLVCHLPPWHPQLAVLPLFQHSTQTHVSCFSCGHGPCLHPLQYLLAAHDSARPVTRCISVCKWAVQALPWLSACKTEDFLPTLEHSSTSSLRFPKTSELSHIIIFLPLFQLFLELCPGSSCGISIPEVGLGIQD